MQYLKNITLFIYLTLHSGFLVAQGSNFIEIRGTIINQETNEPISGVSILVKGTVVGTRTNPDGSFVLRAKAVYPFTLQASSIGFDSQEFEVSGPNSRIVFALQTQTLMTDEVVVRAKKISDQVLESSVAIEKLNIRALRETPSASFYDAMENTKGVQLTTSSLTFKVPNSRGFNIPNNFRFVQLADGVDMQAATLGVPLGNAIGPTELDILSMEITPGASSGLYGMNAVNGMAQLITKNPFDYQGVSVYQKGGINHLGEEKIGGLTESSIRIAKAFKDKLAFKVNFSYLQGKDWVSNTRLNQNPNSSPFANPSFSALKNGSVAFDGWNKYGDDALAASNTVSITGLNINGSPNQTLTVARTGYWENELVNPVVNNLKFDVGLYYKFNSNLMLNYAYRYGIMDGVFQRGNKVQLNDVVVQNHKLELKGERFVVRAYLSKENTGNSYNLKPLADNMDLYSGGSNSVWGTKYKDALQTYAQNNGGVLNNDNLQAANAYARAQADAGRVEYGTDAFEQLKNTIVEINNWDIQSAKYPNAPLTGGAKLFQKSNTYHIEGNWDLSDKIKVFDLFLGVDTRVYEIIPDGNNFVDFSRPIVERNVVKSDGTFGNPIYYQKMGLFVQGSKKLFEDKLKLTASLRTDYNPAFSPKFTPRVSAVYLPTKNQSFRASYQQGYRFPSLFEALSYVNNGNVKRVGILPSINEGLGYMENSYTQRSVAAFNTVVKQQGNTDAAALANRNLLQVANLPQGKPEKISSFELGYKKVLFNNKLALDWDGYFNAYKGFIGQVQVFVPHGAKVGSDAAVIAMLDRNRDAQPAQNGNGASEGQDRYRVYTNAQNTYLSFGSAFSASYQLPRNYILNGSVSYNQLKENAQKDLFITGFNTPNWSTNITFSNREILKNLGFSAVYRWQEAFLWESPLVTGEVPAFGTIDAQVTYQIPRYNSSFKIGGTNILNKRYFQYAGGPILGALFYAAVTIEGLGIK